MWCGIAVLGAILIAQDASVIRVPVHMVAVPTLVFSKENRRPVFRAVRNRNAGSVATKPCLAQPGQPLTP